MLTKILFTALVIVVVLAFARFRARAAATQAAAGPTRASPRLLRGVTVAAAVALVAGAALFYWSYWRGWHEVLTVRVIDTRTHDIATYRIYKGTLHDRSFETTDGWKVTVSAHERLEVRSGQGSDQRN